MWLHCFYTANRKMELLMVDREETVCLWKSHIPIEENNLICKEKTLSRPQMKAPGLLPPYNSPLIQWVSCTHTCTVLKNNVLFFTFLKNICQCFILLYLFFCLLHIESEFASIESLNLLWFFFSRYFNQWNKEKLYTNVLFRGIFLIKMQKIRTI